MMKSLVRRLSIRDVGKQILVKQEKAEVVFCNNK